MLWSTLDSTAFQNKDLKCYLIIIYQFNSNILCPPQMERETFLSQVDLEAPFQADLEMEADEFESNNNQNENDPEPEKVHSIAETLLSLSNIRAHLMSLGEDTEAFDSLKKLESIFIKKTIEESQSKQADITKFFPVNQLTLR